MLFNANKAKLCQLSYEETVHLEICEKKTGRQ